MRNPLLFIAATIIVTAVSAGAVVQQRKGRGHHAHPTQHSNKH